MFLNAASISLKRAAKRLPAFPMYALWQSGQVSLYTPDSENLPGEWFFAGKQGLNCVFGAECYFQVSLSEDVCNIGRFFAYIGKRGPLFFGYSEWC